MADQDDLLLLHHLRAHASGEETRVASSQEALMVDPGRAAGRVTSWAMGRTIALLQRFGRQPWGTCCALAPSVQEARLSEVVRALSQYDRPRAEAAALWLVRKADVSGLLDRAAPLAVFYSAAAGANPSVRRAAQA